jgi:thiol:disulfide interchange protein DsbA
MRFLRPATLALCLLASTAFASPTNPRDGVEYTTLAAPQPTQAAGKKVEVIEFFMYHCPVCNALEPELEEWVRKQGDNIVLRRVHMPYTGPNDPEAHLFLTLEAMGVAEQLAPKVFHARHVERLELTDAAILGWVGKNGIDKARFTEVWSSFGVMTKLRQAQHVLDTYKVESVPTLVIDGRYATSPGHVSGTGVERAQVFKATMQVADALVAKAARNK